MIEIYLSEITDARVIEHNTTNGTPRRDYHIRINPDNPILEYQRKQSPHFWLRKYGELKVKNNAKIADADNPLMSPSAGAVAVLNDEEGQPGIICLSQKDEHSPRDPGFFVARNGFAQSEQDWYSMDHLKREAYEEGIFVTKSTNELLLAETEEFDNITYERASMLEKQTGITISGTKRIPITFHQGPDTLNIYRGGSQTIHKTVCGSVTFTPESGFQILQQMHIPYPATDVWAIDTETFPNGNLIKRHTALFTVDDLQNKKFGDTIDCTVQYLGGPRYTLNQKMEEYEGETEFYVCKSVRAFLHHTTINLNPIYPRDWMSESEEFLSNKEFLRHYSEGANYSGFEKQLLSNKD